MNLNEYIIDNDSDYWLEEWLVSTGRFDIWVPSVHSAYFGEFGSPQNDSGAKYFLYQSKSLHIPTLLALANKGLTQFWYRGWGMDFAWSNSAQRIVLSKDRDLRHLVF